MNIPNKINLSDEITPDKYPLVITELNRLQAQYAAVVKQNQELQQDNRILKGLNTMQDETIDRFKRAGVIASHLYYNAISNPQERANAMYKIYE